jgi:predicted RNA-binding Zn ribbon-like protein
VTSLANRVTVEAAMAFATMIQSGQFSRLRDCAAADCHDVLVDLSKNRSRRFCSAACANRVNTAAFPESSRHVNSLLISWQVSRDRLIFGRLAAAKLGGIPDGEE